MGSTTVGPIGDIRSYITGVLFVMLHLLCHFINKVIIKVYKVTLHTMCNSKMSSSTVVSTKSDSDFMFCLQSLQGLRIDSSLIY